MSHTKEPWHVDARAAMRVVSENDVTVCSTSGSDLNRDEWEANARRIVACVNALQGVPTEELEQAAELGILDVSSGNLFSARLALAKQCYTLRSALQTQAEEAAKLIGQRDELLEALKLMEAEKSDYMIRNNLGDPSKEHTNKMARAILAKVESSK